LSKNPKVSLGAAPQVKQQTYAIIGIPSK
jgi:hypothetical protein